MAGYVIVMPVLQLYTNKKNVPEKYTNHPVNNQKQGYFRISTNSVATKTLQKNKTEMAIMVNPSITLGMELSMSKDSKNAKSNKEIERTDPIIMKQVIPAFFDGYNIIDEIIKATENSTTVQK